MALEPITRQEKIIAGQDLTPITRMEMFLKQFGGGGGGGSVPKPLTYDYMPEGYPSKAIGTVTVMEEQEVTFEPMGSTGPYSATITNPPEIVVGQTYTVKWGGAEYECVGAAFDESQYVLGNLSIGFGGADTGEPFIYVYVQNGDTAFGYFATLDTSASHTISVKKIVKTVTPMAEEFLPKIPAGANSTTVFYI